MILFPSFPFQWPQFFTDLLQNIQSGHPWSVDLYLRILLAIDSEVVDRHIIHTQEVCMYTFVLVQLYSFRVYIGGMKTSVMLYYS